MSDRSDRSAPDAAMTGGGSPGGRSCLEHLAGLPGPVRAWPGKDGGITFECRDREGLVRAGRLGEDGTPLLLPYATDPGLPGLCPALPGELVVHRPGRRAVLLGADCVRKVTRPGRAAPGDGALAAHEAFARIGLRVPQILGAGRDHLDLERVPGHSLGELGDEGLGGWERLASLWGALVHPPSSPGAGLPDRLLTGLPVHGPEQEAAVLRGWFERARLHGVLAQILDGDGTAQHDGLRTERALEAAVDSACAGLLAAPGTMALAHRDLHEGQLLWDGRDLALIDLDTPALAEPALDLGNLMAHAELMELQGRLSTRCHDRVEGMLTRLASSCRIDSDRLRAYRTAAALRLILVHAFRPGARAWLPRWARRRLAPFLTQLTAH